jgi:deoxyhypusine synthase
LSVWQAMLADDVLIFMGVAGALTPGGMRLILAHAITRRWIDCLVSTGANLYHDLHETRGQRHYMGTPDADDAELQEQGIDRVYDTYAKEDEFIANDQWIAEFVATLEERPYTSREFLYLLGQHLWLTTGENGILTAAYRANVPIFCPAIADSSIGMALSQARHDNPRAGHVDVIGDVCESGGIVLLKPGTASIILGGGTPKNFIDQATVKAWFTNAAIEGHRYAVQITTDVAGHGGASGSTLTEGDAWGHLSFAARRVDVQVDVTIALPLLASALACTDVVGDSRRVPTFQLSGRTMLLNGVPVQFTSRE